MNYRLRDLPRLMSTAAGRLQIKEGLAYRAFPLLSLLATLYRRSVLRRLRLIVVIGSFGKTTTTRALCAALGQPEHRKLPLNAFSYLAAAVLRLRPRMRTAAIEVGISAPGQMVRYARLTRPNVVVVTTIGSEGAEQLGSIERIRDEKADMLRTLGPTDIAVVNGDDANVLWMAQQTRARFVTFGFTEGCDVRAVESRIDWPSGTRLTVELGGERQDLSLRLIGHHMTYPVLAALAVARVEGLDLDEVKAALQDLEPTPRRMEPVALDNGATLLCDDLKSVVETMDAALDVLAEIPAPRRLVVFGDLSGPAVLTGPVYRRMGERVGAECDALLVVGRHLEEYAAGARRAGMSEEAIHCAGDAPQSLAATIRAVSRPGDVVLLKGRRGQALERVRLLLEGQAVGCERSLCDLTIACSECPMLEKGWGDREPVLQRSVRV